MYQPIGMLALHECVQDFCYCRQIPNSACLEVSKNTVGLCRSPERTRQAEKKAAAGQSGLPKMYHQLSMSALHSSRFDDFDFGRHNPTRFAGLENEIANCYANALLQV